MTPFSRYPDETPAQSIDQADLIAFHFHELSRPEERALNRILQSNPALALESAAIAQTLLAFPKNEPAFPIDAAVLERNWQALRPALALHFPQPSTRHFLLRRWTIPALAASALAATALFLTLNHHPQTHPTTLATIQHPASTASLASPAIESTTASASDTQLASSAPAAWTNGRASNSRSTSAPTGSAPTDTRAAAANSAPTESQTANNSANTIASTTTTSPISMQPNPTTTSTSATTATPATTIPPPTATARRTTPALHHSHPVDISLAMFGDFTVNQSFTNTNALLGTGTSTQIVTTAVGALASVHQQLRPWLGYRVTTTYSRPTFNYTFVGSKNPAFTNGGNINAAVYELSGSYVVQGPHRGRITTTAEAGAGLLAFLPQQQYVSGSTFRPAAVAGIGAEYAVTKRFSVHAEYRALVYKAPNFPYTDVYAPVTTNTTLTGNPILGFSYRLGATGND